MEDDDTVVSRVAAVVGGEGCVAEETVAGTGDEADGVNVEVSGTADAEGALHRGLERSVGADSVEPLRVDGARSVSQLEGEASARVVLVHDIDLVLDHRRTAEVRGKSVISSAKHTSAMMYVRDVTTASSGVFADDVPVNVDRRRRRSLAKSSGLGDCVGDEVGLVRRKLLVGDRRTTSPSNSKD